MPACETDIANTIVLTRYLYNKPDVLRSLRWAIFSQQTEEALFWAYEIYYSGFEEEIMGFLFELGCDYYVNARPQFKETWRQWAIEWTKTKNIDLLPTMIINLAKRQPSLIDSAATRDTFRFIIRGKHSISGRKYEAAEMEKEVRRPYKMLPAVSLYSIRIREIMAETRETHEEYIERTHNAYLDKWMYYAWQSPIWRARFEEYGAVLHSTEETVVFPDEDKEEEFMEKWNYEPDEQKIEIHNKHGIYYEPVSPYSREEAASIIKQKM